MDLLFLDANILFSASYRPRSGLARLWQLANARLTTSAYAVEEAERNLPHGASRRRLAKLLQSVHITDYAPELPAPRDVEIPEKDLPILLAAIQVHATHLITGDKKHFKRHFGRTIRGVTILSARAYLEHYR